MSFGLNLLIVGSAAAAGCGAGWWFSLARHQEQFELAEAERRRLQQALDGRPATEPCELSPASGLDDAEAERARDFMAQLQALALHIAEGVGEHNSRVQAINVELGEAGHDAQDVVLAVTKLLDANAQLQQQLASAEANLQKQTQQLQAQIAEARTDALTGLANRRAFDEQLRLLELAFHQQQQPACVMMVDVDNFKAFNDCHGHGAGDEVLRWVARVLEDQLAEQALVCRYGGEEFAALFPGADLARIKDLAERARMALAAARVPWQGKFLQITACAGLAHFTGDDSSEDVLKRADAALYAGKSLGRDRGHWHDGQTVHCMTVLEPLPAAVPEVTKLPPRDPLTGLSTGDAFREDLTRRLAENRRGGEHFTALLIEIDRFAELVAQHGPVAGTVMLRASGQFLRAAMREMDYVARFDAARFALLLPATRSSNAAEVAERLRVAIEKCKLPAEDGLLTFTVSIGMAESRDSDSSDTFVARLEQALTIARRQGGNGIHSAAPLGVRLGSL